MVDCPDWLTEIARQNIAELRATAAIAGSPTEPAPSLPVLVSPETDLLAVEIGREVLRKASQLLTANPGNAEFRRLQRVLRTITVSGDAVDWTEVAARHG